MMELLNFCCDGYVATPIIEACQKYGLFKMLDNKKFSKREKIITDLKANTRYFTIALQTLELLGWLEKNDNDEYRLTDQVNREIVHLNLSPLYAIEPRHLIWDVSNVQIFRKKIEALPFYIYNIDIQSIKSHEGAIIFLLVLALKEFDVENFYNEISQLDIQLAQTIEKLFIHNQWLSADEKQLTATGRQLLQTYDEFDIVLSCRNMLSEMENLLFGNKQFEIEAVSKNNEKYSTDLQQTVINIFNQQSQDEQLQVVVNIGNAGDSLLKEVYQAIYAYIQSQHSGQQSINILGSSVNDDISLYWQQYLQSCVRDIHKSHLLVLENHVLPDQYRNNRAKSLYYDIIHNLSCLYSISAEAFVTIAAGIGLFNTSPVKLYPGDAHFHKIGIHLLNKRDYIIRLATMEDLENLCRLEELCWSEPLRTNPEGIQERLQKYPQGQFVLEKDGQVLGVIYSQCIIDAVELEKCNMDNVHILHEESGSIIQLIAVNIHPQSQNLNYGDQLLEFMLQRCSLISGITKIVAVTLCKKYDAKSDLSFEQYIFEQGKKQDPILAFHYSHGAKIVRALADYRPRDIANQGYGVLVEYDELQNRVRPFTQIETSESESTFDSQQINQFVLQTVSSLLNVDAGTIDHEHPLMEMGLNSVDLMAFQLQLEEKFCQKLQPGFFFEYSNLQKVVDYLIKKQIPLLESNTNEFVTSDVLPSVGSDNHVIADSDIAIIGMSCKLPGGIESPDKLWQTLTLGQSAINSYPIERGNWPSGIDMPGIDQGGFIDHADAFDASFFRMSPSEAQITDPQQRILMELAWKCLEDANILPSELRGSDTGVFVGASNADYSRLVQDAKLEVEAHHATGSSLAVLANRISYYFDLTGPSLLIDTACSSSLVALHTAIQSLHMGGCSSALVAGVNFICHPALSIAYYKAGMLSADARCKVFDAQANGYVRSEGAVVVLIKPLRKAIEDRNQIHAIIKGSSINHGGLAAGLTVPNPQKQSELLVAAWKNAGIAAQDITYIEAHGTGTSLGDPIEIQGIQTAYSQFKQTRQDKICGIGSVKSNLGHLESAAGITGLLKVVLSMKYKAIPATINFSELNPKIYLEDSPFYIQDKLQYCNIKQLYSAGISSFGSGGANAHVVVQEYVSMMNPCRFKENYLFVLSAVNQERLCEYAGKVINWLEGSITDNDFNNAIFSWQTGRVAMKCRLAIKVKDKKDLQHKLKQWVAGNGTADTWFGQVKSSQASDSSNRQSVEQAFSKNDIEQLGILWTSGIDIDWRMLYTGKDNENIPQSISLPTYPFAKERYWINSADIDPQPSVVNKEQESEIGSLLAIPVWQLCNTELLADAQKSEYMQQYVLLCDMPQINIQQIEALIPNKHCLSFSSHQKDIANQYFEIAQICFQEIQKIFTNNQRGKVLFQIVVPYTQEQTILAGLSGLLKTANLENPSFIGQLILTDLQISTNKLAEQLLNNRSQSEDLVVKYESDNRYVIHWEAIQPTIDKPEIAFKNNGVYLITGGLGMLGLLFAKEILHQTTNAKIILTGRSELTAAKQSILDQLSVQPDRLIYKQLDINHRSQVESLIVTIKDEYQTLNGIIHCAGMLAGNFISTKTLEEFKQVLTPKVIGTSNLDFASRDINLDFFVLFSSIASVIGDHGLSDYALANGFMDQFAAYRNQLVAKNERQGKTLSINWPLWKEGGIIVDSGSQARLLHTIGMIPMQTITGIKSFHQILSLQFSQVMVIEGLLSKIETALKEQNQVYSFETNIQLSPTVNSQVLYEKVLQKIKQLFGKIFKLPVSKIDENEALLSYGIDSIFINQLNLELSKIFCAIPKTLFFEYQTLADLTKYLVREHVEESLSWTGLNEEQLNSQRIDNPFPSLDSMFSHSTSSQSGEPDAFVTGQTSIAIIGVSGIYPDAANIEEYWENLKTGKNSISEIPSERWPLENFYEPDKKNALKEGKSYCKHGGFINQFSQFDPLFFGISPREAMNIDPQERLFLQASYHALEDSGYTRSDLKNKYKQRVGVFAGITKTGFDAYGTRYSYGDEKFHPRTSFGSVANRVSYFFDINGPSIPVDTMCSSSLTAIHEACEHIIRGECSMAFAGGVNLYLHPSTYVWLSAQHMLSQDGYCRSFGAGANGFVPGEGVGVFLLKPLSQAIQDNDNIQGVILSTHINHGGKVNGYFVPNPNAQTKLIRHAIEKAGINARDISYIEAHGTGTDLGDPIEIRALQQAFAKDTQEIGYCKIGSAKSNIGHLESAAGIAGVTKVLLQMKHRQIAPSLHSRDLNPNIDFQKTPFVVNQQLETWDNHVAEGLEKSRIAGVSSFGAGGVNAHVIVQEFVPKQSTVHTGLDTNVIIPLSAKTEKQLRQKLQDLLNFIRTNPSTDLQAMGYTLLVGREAMDERLAFIVDSLEQLSEKLQAYITGEQNIEDVFRGQVKRDKDTTTLFNEDSDLQQTVSKWISQRELTKLLSLWVKGLEIDWNKFYTTGRPQRISLPTYPFADDRYWIDSLVEQSALPAVDKILRPLLNTKSLTEFENASWDRKSYLSKWEEQVTKLQENQVNHEVVLIVCRNSSFQFEKTIQKYYEQNKGCRTLLIRLAENTQQVLEKEWLCGIQDPSGFQTCLKDIAKIDAMYFLSMTDQQSFPLSFTELADSQKYNEIQLLHLVKYLKQNKKIGERLDTYLLTLDNYSINHQPIRSYGAGVNGFGYSLAQGNYQFLVRNIDLFSGDLKNEQDQKNVFEMILQEPLSNRGEVFKFQSGRRYRQTFIRQIWDTTDTSVIKQNGVYLIVGGSGMVGQIITRNLIRKYQATVIWIGRSAANSEKVRKSCLLFEEYGKKIFYVQADVTNTASMKEAIKLIKEKYATIHGAVFAGMVFDFDNSIDQTTEAEFRNILDVKIFGSWNFYHALKQEPLDFMCYFSSGQAYSFSGASKLSAYATGITFADSFVQSLKEVTAFPTGIINWGFWKSSVNEMEKGVSTENLDALEDQEGFECFEQFVNELEQRRLKQVLCMKTSPQVESLMNCNQEENIILTKKHIFYPALSLERTIEIPYKEISALKMADEQNELDEWLIQLIYCKISDFLESKNIRKRSQKISDLAEDCNIIDKYVPWWNESISLLSQKGYILLQDDIINNWKPLDTKEILTKWQIRKEKYCRDSNYKAHAILANDCLEKLPEILTGQILSTDVIFPNSSMEKVEGVYKNNHLSDIFNEIIANTVVAYVRQRIGSDPHARLKILEIGAGTGGTSAIIFSKIRSFKESIEEYCYTDLSKAFFFHAEEKYGAENPYLRCQRLDIGLPVEEQGIEIGTYDLVIATNVLHATKNIRQTLRNAKAILHQKGFLLINELSNRSIFNHLTFGLLDGWWLFEDQELRIPNCPALHPASWQRVLEEEGFSSVFFPVKESHDLGQQIIVAQSDGIVRQKVDNKSCKQNTQSVQYSNAVVKKHDNQLKKSDVILKLSPNIQEYVLNNVLDSFSSTLKISPENINPNMAFFDYGLDSILGVYFIDQINKRFSISLNTAIIFEYSTITLLSEHIVARYREQIEKQIHNQTELSPDLDVNLETMEFENSLPPKKDLQLRIEDNFSYNEKKSGNKNSEIAVIGISGMFPKAENVTEFWENLIQGIDGISELPDRYLDREKYFSTEKQSGKTRCKWGGILEERDCFDPLFFKISAKEAEAMNPHQRLVLQESWKAIENAGYNPNELSGTQTGIFIGAEPTGYMGDSFTGYSDAIIASRLSYYANLNGPAFVINTGCSSSAVAIHVACESLRNEETDLAIAGGVYAYLNQKFLVSLDETGMLSPTGRCFTFDSAADGTVLSEGIGIIVLKRLEDAVAAGDFIYGIICGSGINQDGASNGITAPNGVAQEKLITDVYDKFQIDPEKISYVEAHGTGTNLGDPVEANALIRAFNKYTTKQNFCCIGSAKSHIGHTSSASGVIGLIKVLLSMRHKQIPKLLNFKTLNPLIDFDKSPFYINADVTEWKSKENTPRMAALSSFGHSGTNAHLVVKEYLAKREERATHVKKIVIVPLSARTPEQLGQKASDLLNFIRKEQSIELESMAYTLQVGREAMDERLGFVVSSIGQLAEKLQAYIDGVKDIEGIYQGKTKRDKDLLSLFSGDIDIQETIEKWIIRQKFPKLLTLWINGVKLDWQKLYVDGEPKRVVLPVYPFAKERYWIDTSILPISQVTMPPQTSYLHPILHHNTSNLNQQSYDSTFVGDEFFLKDHQINGQKMLPAVAYLEMARAAVEKAVPVSHKTGILELHNIVWIQPIVVEKNKTVSIALYTNEGIHKLKIDYEIYGTDMEQGLVHCQGLAVFSDEQIPAKIDLTFLKEQMNRGKLDKSFIYTAYNNMGTNFGLSHQGISVIHKGDKQLLAQLNLPDVIDNTFDDYVLHPCMMDSALQATLGLIIDGNEPLNQPLLPFSLERLRVIGTCQKEMFSWVRYSAGSKPGDKLVKLDIDLCDRDGNICVQMKGFSSRTFTTQTGTGETAVTSVGHLLLTPVWQSYHLASSAFGTGYGLHEVLLYDFQSVTLQELSRLYPSIVWHARESVEGNDLADRYRDFSRYIFRRVQTLLKEKPREKILYQVVIADDWSSSLFQGISGLFRTAAQENPLFYGQVIQVPALCVSEKLIEYIRGGSSIPQEPRLRYTPEGCSVLGLEEISFTGSQVDVFKDHGVYLITGGAGGLGLLFAEYILRQSPTSQLILTGRSSVGNAHLSKLSALAASGDRFVYRPVDITDAVQVRALIEEIKERYGVLNGILHSAGVISDNYILKKTEDEFEGVLAPKVRGVVNLDTALGDMDLDFLVLFSSTSSWLGNAGQADYSAANGFMDSFSSYRNHLSSIGRRKGKTVSVNWPLWQEGGMQITGPALESVRRSTGMYPMSTRTGLAAFVGSLSGRFSQTLVVEGDLDKIRRTFSNDPLLPAPSPSVSFPSGDLKAKTQDYLRGQFAIVLKFPSQKIDSEAALEEYGIDSILSMNLTGQLEEGFGSLPKTLFFEYQTIAELSEYFIEHHRSKLEDLLGLTGGIAWEESVLENKNTVNPSVSPSPVVPRLIPSRRFSRVFVREQAVNPIPSSNEAIAIIGLSGRYPSSPDLESYWVNLREGRDCITEVPLERWDWRDYYREDHSGAHRSKWGGFISGVDEFDPRFFNISPREASQIDPQERLFLQYSWMAVEDAGYTRRGLQLSHPFGMDGQVGVYAGVMYGEYNLSGSLASIANRVSYVLNLHGPSLTLDTMCSSSLTAIHLACQDLKQGRTDMAIAGGVNVSIHPNKYRLLSQGGFISSSGHCQSFGEGGDGYIPGEGVGVVVLKRLSQAEVDGDHIYGVILGSALNHGGKTNGYTVPNLQAQIGVIAQALRESGVSGDQVSYIEAHGTGTKLGDPIEISSLSKGMQRTDGAISRCLIGSAKSNIGHCESAAGIAGLTKILLQMKHRQIVSSLHSSRLNPNIDFSRLPFEINQHLRSWDSPVTGGKEQPRIAGLSSFGAGGSNAHFILQEYIAPVRSTAVAVRPSIVPLSARTETQLLQKAAELLDFIRSHHTAEHPMDLSSLAYTLQVGREGMEERLGILAVSVDDLASQLEDYLSERTSGDLFRGQVKPNKEAVSRFNTDSDLRATIDRWILGNEASKLVDWWVKGLDLNWSLLYGEYIPPRISLPTYPFAHERYWSDMSINSDLPSSVLGAVIHPLLHINTSDFSRNAYSSTFRGEESFIRDYPEMSGKRIFPPAAFLEMAREALVQAVPQAETSGYPELLRVSFGEPALPGLETDIHIVLFTRDTRRIFFEIYSGEDTVHCQGEALFTEAPFVERVDILRLESQMREGKLYGEELYVGGILSGYGASYQVIRTVHLGSGQLLAALTIPDSSAQPGYVLAPALLEGALQAVRCLQKSFTLVSIDSVRLVSACTDTMYAWVRYAKNDVTHIDIDLLDDQGKVCCQMKGISYPALSGEPDKMPDTGTGLRTLSIPEAAFTEREQKKPSNISLFSPISCFPVKGPYPSDKNRVKLSAISPTSRDAFPESSRSAGLLDLGNGIFSIRISPDTSHPTLAGALIEDFLSVLKAAGEHPSLKVLTIEGLDNDFLSGGRSDYNECISQGLYASLVTFPYPVIAVMKGDSSGAGFLAGLLCDFMVCSEESRYAYAGGGGLYPSQEEYLLFEERLGTAQATDFLYMNADSHSGSSLRSKGWTIAVLPACGITDYVQTLATGLSVKTRDSLGLLKRHLSRSLAEKVSVLQSVEIVGDSLPSETSGVPISPSSELVRTETSGSVLSVSISFSESGDAISAIIGELETLFSQANTTEQYRSIVLGSDHPDFLPEEISPSDLQSLQHILDSSLLPVVCLLESGAKSKGWYISLFCQAVVYHDQGLYSSAGILQHPALSAYACVIYSESFGPYYSREILLTGGDYSGMELSGIMGVLTVSGKDSVVSKGMDIARHWSEYPRESLTAWKSGQSLRRRHMIPGYTSHPGEIEKEAPVETGTPIQVELDSKVIRATSHPGGILEIRMEDRSDRNMFSESLVSGLNEVFDHIALTPYYKVVVLTGYDTYFASGGTKEGLLSIQEGKSRFTDTKIYQLTLECRIPVIAAMQGHGIGAGWCLGMFSDLVLLSEESHYVSPYMKYGFTPGAGATLVFPYKAGRDLSNETLLTAREYTGRELADRGLSLPVLRREKLIDSAFTLARAISRYDRDSLINAKEMFTQPLRRMLEDTFRRELQMHDKTFVGQSHTLDQIKDNFLDNNDHQLPSSLPAQSGGHVWTGTPEGWSGAGITETLKILLAEELYMQVNEIDEDVQFVDLGLDSITGVTWIRKINEKYKTTIDATKVYSYPTLSLMSGFVRQEATKTALLDETNAHDSTGLDIGKSALSGQGQNAADPTRWGESFSAIISSLKILLSEELYMQEEEIDEDVQFVDLGLDSITGVTWVRKINERYGTAIEATRIYAYPTVRRFAEYVKEVSAGVRMNPVPVVESRAVPPYREDSGLGKKGSSASVINKKAPLTSWRKRFSGNSQSAGTCGIAQPIAVIGMAGQFPQADNVEEFWKNISEGKNCVREIPASRWDIGSYYREGAPVPGKTNCKWIGALNDYDAFDPLFFTISPLEAESMDPQQRLFLQTCYHSIENAGYNPKSLSGSKCGVFAGCATGDYQLLSRNQQLSAQGFTGGSASILAARISYFLDLQGPCISIDTACSSSLVAIANACDSLLSGSSDLALAGGVYVMTGPEMHIKTAQSGMLSTDGKCHTFDVSANGFVPGEAVGVVFLKRLSDAERDQDRIYGVIEGWGTNQDGKTNGITAPNTVSQTRLEQEVYDRFGIDPSEIQLIEAHGTGTKLGDPIEVDALKQAFKKYTQGKGYCALGSVKTNIGHCLTAAGVASFMKVLSALEHKQLPPTIHFEELNEHIDLSSSPFYINTRLKDWDPGVSGKRRAAVSAFGFSGTNAHVVVSEYIPAFDEPDYGSLVGGGKFVVPLSARTPEQLKRKVQDLQFFLSDHQQADLGSLSYTLQSGREPMEERVVFVVASVMELESKLEEFTRSENAGGGDYRGQVKYNRDGLRIINQDNEMKETLIDKWISQKNLTKLLDLWAKGLEFDWNRIYGGDKPKRMHLPVYPFEKERYWIEKEEAGILPLPMTKNVASFIHPLLHENVSNFSQQSYCSNFNGEEFFLKDHQVQGQKVLPAVAYLEMAKVAIENALPAQAESELIELCDTVWIQPVVVDENKQVTIHLYVEEDGRIAFEVYSTENERKVIHCQGQAVLSHRLHSVKLDIEESIRKIEHRRFEPSDLYPVFTERGIDFGLAHQGILCVYKGDEELFAEIRLPKIVEKTHNDYSLHPSIMDSALQASMKFIEDLVEDTNNPLLPFALGTLRVISTCKKEMIAWVRYSAGSKPGDKLIKLDIDLCDRDGNICVQMEELSARVLESKTKLAKQDNRTYTNNKDDMINDNVIFYERVIEQIINREISVDEAIELE